MFENITEIELVQQLITDAEAAMLPPGPEELARMEQILTGNYEDIVFFDWALIPEQFMKYFAMTLDGLRAALAQLQTQAKPA